MFIIIAYCLMLLNMGWHRNEYVRLIVYNILLLVYFMKRDGVLLLVFGVLLLFSVVMIIIENFVITGRVTESTTSSVVISQYFSIAMSPNLVSGISFGTQDSTSASDINGTNNYDGGSSGTTYYMNVSSDSNAAVDFTIGAVDALNTTGGDEIGLGNETYASSSSTDASTPSLSSEVALTTNDVSAGEGIVVGGNVYYRFWLDIPAGTPVGTYTNTINFKGEAAS